MSTGSIIGRYYLLTFLKCKKLTENIERVYFNDDEIICNFFFECDWMTKMIDDVINGWLRMNDNKEKEKGELEKCFLSVTLLF